MSLLLGTAASLAALHTLIGVDHSIPFIVLGRSRGWALRRTLLVTGAGGLVHVASSVFIGLFGVAFGVALDRLAWIEEGRGQLAAALMIGFGLAYAAWAAWRGLRRHRHDHVHSHPHHDRGGHLHVHEEGRGMTPWVLFLIFAFGPCEALIPLMMVPALEQSWGLLIGVVMVFGTFRVGTMLMTVLVGHFGLSRARLGGFERQVDLLAGLTVAASGAAVLVLGV